MRCQWMISLLLLVPAAVSAAPAGDLGLPAGVIKVVQGEATILRDSRTIPAEVGFLVMGGDRVSTGPSGKVGITLRDNTMLSAGPCSTLTIAAFAFNQTTLDGVLDATLSRGTMAVISGKLSKSAPAAVKFRTPATIVGVRGTEFVMAAGAPGCD